MQNKLFINDKQVKPEIKELPEVVFSRVIIKRNLDKYPFVDLLNSVEKDEIENKLIALFTKNDLQFKIVDLKYLDDIEKEKYIFKGLIAKRFALKKTGRFLLFEKENLSLVFHYDDHLTFYISRSDLDFNFSIQYLEGLFKIINNQFQFAASMKYGYLTKQVKNCGLAMNLSTLLHLPGIKDNKKIDELMKAYNQRGFVFKPWNYISGEKKETDYFLIISKLTFGVTEQSLVSRFIDGLQGLSNLNLELLIQNRNKNKDEFVDKILRSYGLLRYAHKITLDEALQHLSLLRSGLSLKEKLPINLNKINKVFYEINENHVEKLSQTKKMEKNVLRAQLIRRILT